MNRNHTPDDLNTARQRLLPFKGISNFRDLGGYPAEDGARVKWGLLYRSGKMGRLRSADNKRLQALQLEAIIDFRSENEKTRGASRLPNSMSVRTISLPVPDLPRDGIVQELRAAARAGDVHRFDPSQKMEALYRSFAVQNQDQYRRFIHIILGADGRPVLWHCTAGKDRTGFAAAILLRILGVPQEQVLADYLLSSQYADRRENLIRFIRFTRGKEVASLIQGFFLVRPEWLQAAFQAVDQTWGDFNTYCREALALSPEDIQTLRASLLTPPLGT